MADLNGYIDQVTTDRLIIRGWVRTTEDTEPNLRVTISGKTSGEVVFGAERGDVRKATGLPNRAFAVTLPQPVNAVEVLGGGVQVLLEIDGEEYPLPLSSGGRQMETKQALSELTGTVSDGTKSPSVQAYDNRNAQSYAVEVNEAGKSGQLTPVSFPIGLRSRDNAARLGHDGHIFLIEGSNNLLEKYKEPSSQAEQENLDKETHDWVDLVQDRHKRISGLGMDFVQIVIPEKLTAMRELAPVEITGPTPLLRNIDRNLANEEYWVSGLKIFENWESPIAPWQKNDSHNSAAGSLAIARELLAAIPVANESLLAEVPLTNRSYRDGDLTERFFGLPLWDEHLDPEPEFLRESSQGIVNTVAYSPEKGHLGTHMVWENSKAPIKKSVVVFGNSFFGQGANSPAKLGWWFTRLFAEYHLVWKPEIDYDYLAKSSPDIVIAQTIERFLGRFPTS